MYFYGWFTQIQARDQRMLHLFAHLLLIKAHQKHHNIEMQKSYIADDNLSH